MSQARQSWSTSPYVGPQAVRIWQDLVAQSLIACDIKPTSMAEFDASMTRYAFGPVTVQQVRSTGSYISRTRQQIRRDRKDGYFVIHQVAGTVAIEQHGRTAIARTGDCLLLSARSPYTITAEEPFIGLSMSVPNAVLEGWLPDPEVATARTIDGSNGWGRALSAAMATFANEPPEDLALPAPVVVGQILAHLAISLGTDSSPATLHQRALLRRLGDTIYDRYREPDFDPSQLAGEHGLSKRYVHLLFARAGTSFGKELARVRLENAKRLLEDKRFHCVDIMEIALRCGFKDSSGFSKRFRGEYGRPPSAYRRQIQGQDGLAHVAG